MNQNRRLVFAAAAIAASTLVFASPARAWSINFGGSGEAVRGSGEIASETRDVGAFDGISTTGDFQILVRQGSTNRVEVKTDRNVLPYIETRVVAGDKGRMLEIGTKRGFSLRTSATPQLVLEMPQLRAISIAGSGDVKVEAMKTAGVDATIAGSGSIVFANLSSDRLGVKVSGSGDVSAAGRTGNLVVSIAGSGDVKTRALAADDVKVSIAGSGDALVQALKTLKVSIAGSGDVAYIGSPEISTSVAGNGRVKKLTD